MSNREEIEILSLNGPAWQRASQVIGVAKDQGPSDLALRLVALPGGRVVEVRQSQVTIGRHADVDLQILERDVSRRHCRLVRAADAWYIEDLGSLNGTFLNGEQVKRSMLNSSDVIRVGDRLFQVELTGDVEAGDSEHPDRQGKVLRGIAALLDQEQPASPGPQRQSA